MAAPVSLQTLVTRTLRLANMGGANDQFASQAAVVDLINEHLSELYDILVNAGPPDYYATDVLFSSVAGQTSYPLSTIAPDFRSLIEIYANDVSGPNARQRPLSAITDSDRAWYVPPQGAYSLTMRYIPIPPVLVNLTDTFDGVSGWDSLVTRLAARDLMIAEETDATQLNATIAETRQRIMIAADNRNRGQPRRITDVADFYRRYPYFVTLNAFQLVGNNINLYTSSPIFP